MAANAVNGTKGSIGSVYLSQIVTAHALPTAASIKSKVSTLYLYNNHLDYKLFMIPALLTIVMMLYDRLFANAKHRGREGNRHDRADKRNASE